MQICQSQTPKLDASEIRLPLDHPETDSLDLRIRELIFSGLLTEAECGFLIKKRKELRRVDAKLARRLLGLPLPATDCRPLYPDEARMPLSAYFGMGDAVVAAGWVHRLREYVERIEAKYGLAAEGGCSVYC